MQIQKRASYSRTRFFLASIFLLFSFAALSAANIFAADGDIDPAFNASFIAYSSEAVLYKVLIGANEKIYVSGLMTQVNGVSNIKGIVRLNADGTTDTTFNPAIDGLNQIHDFAVYPDNKVVLAAQSGGGPKILRLNADGSLDASFTPQPFNTLPEYISSFAIQPDGKILVGGSFSKIGGATHTALARLNADGTIDSSFNPVFGKNGVPSDEISTIVVQPDNKILVGGSFQSVNGQIRFDIARLNADGTSDTVFNQGLGTQRDANGQSAGVNEIRLLADGRIYYNSGALVYNGTSVSQVVRLNPNGTIDTTFNLKTYEVSPVGLAIQADGKILAVGTGQNYTAGYPQIRNGVVRINTDGSIDTSFSPVGIPIGDIVYSVAVQADGKILLVGRFTKFSGTPKNSIVRLLNNAGTTPPTIQKNRMSDFDGDGRADASVFRSGTWYISGSLNNNFSAVQFGVGRDRIVSADYDGDGKTDIAVWRENSGNPDLSYFYILNSADGTFAAVQFSRTGDAPIAGDWDGDGKADVAVYRNGGTTDAQSRFFYRPTTRANVDFTTLSWGAAGDKPMRGDFDGDGKLDAAVFRPATNLWYIQQSSNQTLRVVNWGLASDRFVSADYDGDGKTDPAVFRGGVWYVLQSSDNQPLYRNWGLSTDTLVPADFDGDGKTDVAVWRNGVYYILNSVNGQPSYQYFGTAGDVPVASAFVQ